MSKALEKVGWNEVERRERLGEEETFPKALGQKGTLHTVRER